MRVYVSADMEGVTGLVDAADTQLSGRDYEHGRVMMTEDVNAAVRGAFAGGADEVVVNDAHGSMRNTQADRVHERAVLVRGVPKPMGMLEGIPGVKRRDSRSVEAHGAVPELFRPHAVFMRVAASVTGQQPYC